MDSLCITTSSSLHHKILRHAESNPSCAKTPLRNTTLIGFKITKSSYYYTCLCYLNQQQHKSVIKRRLYAIKTQKCSSQLSKNSSKVAEKKKKKKGTVFGAVALVIGTCIGSGILALPEKAYPAGFLPSSISVIVCWFFLLIEALLLVEINVALMKKRGKKVKEDKELEVISIRTMAQETLGNWGGTLATTAYVFLGYSSMVAYSSKSGEILSNLINFPVAVSGSLFTAFFTILVFVGGTRATDQVNQYLTSSMIGLLLTIEVMAVVFGGWSGVGASSDWGKVPPTIPVIIFSLVYHDLAPVLCAYLEGDLRRIKASIFLGSLVPLVALVFWDAIALGLASESDQVIDPVELLYRVRWSGVSLMVGTFSLLAVGTSLIGTLLGFSEFFKEQLRNLTWYTLSTQKGNWCGRNKMNAMAVTMVVVPSLIVSTTFPNAFSAATDIAGGYCMTVLYGVLPPAMAWAMHKREPELSDKKQLSNARPALIVVGLFASSIVVEQILQDILALHS
ncbi:putative amino acid/polyamine transporter 2 [Lupinus albus]|uniref:Putative amino acid/polyamine transporter 2 n=1 Tax=Lupinus albus TaxID=3870 RepID=A0A6A4NX99_LUPAL|nr:putative amino acid/polyamine transporter 2 [Lupinus albus]